MSINNFLAQIAKNAGFLKSAGQKFDNENEKLELVGTDAAGKVIVKDDSNDQYALSKDEVQSVLGVSNEDLLVALDIQDEDVDSDDAIDVNLDVDETSETTSTTASNATNATTATNSTTSATETQLQAEIDDLKTKKAANDESMEKLQTQITELKDKAQKKIEEAIDKMEEATEAQKKRSKEIVEEQIAQFEADKKAGKEVDPDSLSDEVAKALAAEGMPTGFTKALQELISADADIKLMDGLLNQLNTRIQTGKTLEDEIASKEDEMDKAKETAKQSQQTKQKLGCCDPIGFQNEDGVQFDFFYDEDGDGKINDVTDFVGASDKEDGWNEMSELDTKSGNNDGKIDSDELESKDIKVMVTSKDGSQEALSISEFEEQYGELEINTNKDAAVDSSVNGPNNFADDAKNSMIGTFGLTVGGEELKGYQTLDSTEWLDKNYDITNGIEGADETIGKAEGAELNEFEKFANDYAQNVMPKLKEDLAAAYEKLGVDKEYVNTIEKMTQIQADQRAAEFEKELEKEEAEKLEKDEAAKAEEEKKAEEKEAEEAKAQEEKEAEEKEEKEE